MAPPEKQEEYQVNVVVHEARGLLGMDDNHMSDPMTLVQIGPVTGQRRWTEVKRTSINVVWETRFIFNGIRLTSTQFDKEKIHFKVYDRNTFFRNALIGSYEFTLSNVHRQKQHQYYRKWVPLVDPTNHAGERGFLLLSVYTLKAGEPTPEPPIGQGVEEDEILTDPTDPELRDRKPYILNVIAYRARDLLSQQKVMGSRNPFVSVRFNSNTIQTNSVTKTENPVWNRKLELPFAMPLRSDSIEVQVWNENKGRPDVLIGDVSFNFYTMSLNLKPFGPKWINLYSAQYTPTATSFFGSIKDALTGPSDEHNTRPHEYVGRILLRMSVASREWSNLRLMNVPANPTAEPEGDDYVVHFVCYRASEIPVSGGHCAIEVVFGPERRMSEWVANKKREGDGMFVWNSTIEPISLYCPIDIEQVPDIIINVFHKVGSSQRKIGFERIPAIDLLDKDTPSSEAYSINGNNESDDTAAAWNPNWHMMHHPRADSSNPASVAGFLLCSVGFGLKSAMEMLRFEVPKPLAPREKKYSFKFSIIQGANLLAADANGLSNPCVVVRFAGRSHETKVEKNTLFPFWYESHDMAEVLLDPNHSPSVYINVYHKVGWTYKLIGRTEVDTKHITQNNGKYFRYRLRYDEVLPCYDAVGDKDPEEQVDKEPYIVAAFALNQFSAAGTNQTPIERLDTFRKYAVKFHCIGLRGLDAAGLPSPPQAPYVDVSIPQGSQTMDENKKNLKLKRFIPKGEKVQGNSSHIMQSQMFDAHLQLPQFNPFGVPLIIKACDEKAMSDVVLGTSFTPVASFLPASELVHFRRLPSYPDPLKPDSSAEAAKAAKQRNALQKRADDEEDVAQEIYLDISPDHLNTRVGYSDSDEDQKFSEVQELLPEPKTRRGKRKHGNKQQEEKTDIKVFKLHRGRQVAPSSTMSAVFSLTKSQFWLETVSLKASVSIQYVGGDNEKEVESKLEAMRNEEMPGDSLLRQIYSHKYVTRLYLFKGLNLRARTKEMLNPHQSTDPYVVVKNGTGPGHYFRNDGLVVQRESSPDFFQVFELVTRLPENHILDIQVWDQSSFGSDEFVGSCQVDLEERILEKSGYYDGTKESKNLKTRVSDISQGSLSFKLDVFPEEMARRLKAEEIHAPQAENFELRLVIWNTKSVVPADDKEGQKDINQRIVVNTNFDGRSGGGGKKQTDVAWNSNGGAAEWNYRMIWPVTLPCKVPRLRITMWDVSAFTSNDISVGEILFNLQPFFDKCIRDKKPISHMPQRWVDITHSNFQGKVTGQMCIELWLYSNTEAKKTPAGEAQSEPNVDPYLPNPHRNPPPWALGSLGFNFFGKYKVIIILVLLLVVGAGVAVLATQMG
mmetsp:Transcript_8495/g.16195  ORF Transcript_8495/g.16195 Transcript_8495/m.16195 type:complete len:1348 (-) Transcript_8495:95-4138(-)|eukprot:CAMPEP_0175123606 /NCGR_PEP_ID=MMETSP0087-20121206/2335_1 /TAXON_ID=136419 /ORGANISM="Unknown Unknown, Strain D1" /LENGTH=1347 /DNA_ID=CAMNT_0016405313 /DNA_START=77 /DNA_END=4123 /DNA_ORIENTATION=-